MSIKLARLKCPGAHPNMVLGSIRGYDAQVGTRAISVRCGIFLLTPHMVAAASKLAPRACKLSLPVSGLRTVRWDTGRTLTNVSLSTTLPTSPPAAEGQQIAHLIELPWPFALIHFRDARVGQVAVPGLPSGQCNVCRANFAAHRRSTGPRALILSRPKYWLRWGVDLNHRSRACGIMSLAAAGL